MMKQNPTIQYRAVTLTDESRARWSLGGSSGKSAIKPRIVLGASRVAASDGREASSDANRTVAS